MRPTVKNIKRITVAWNERQRHLRAQGLQAKEAILLNKENKKLAILDS